MKYFLLLAMMIIIIGPMFLSLDYLALIVSVLQLCTPFKEDSMKVFNAGEVNGVNGVSIINTIRTRPFKYYLAELTPSRFESCALL